MTVHFTTIGHSNRTLQEFLDLLRAGRVDVVADVRSFPRSRSNPVFNIDTLPARLAEIQIGYHHFAALGGRRPRQTGTDPQTNALWRVQSFHNYADYAQGDAFAAAFKELCAVGQDRRVALMCSEAVWWRCHRRIIADYLIANGYEVEHLMGVDRIEGASLTAGARKTPEGKVIYPAA